MGQETDEYTPVLGQMVMANLGTMPTIFVLNTDGDEQ
jgi:hypothetical protein